MTRTSTITAVLLALPITALAQAPPTHRVFVAPYVSVGDGGGAGLVAGKLTDGLKGDLLGRTSQLGFITDAQAPRGQVGGAFGGGGAPGAANLAAARNRVKIGAGLLETGRFEEAMAELGQALALFEANLAFMKREKELVEVHLQLAAAAFQSGYEDDGEAALEQALVMDPEIRVAGRGFPPLFERLARKFRKRFKRVKKKGVLAITSDPTPATVFVNGVEVGSTPLELDDLLPGRHYVRLVRPMSGVWARKIDGPLPETRAELTVPLPAIGGEAAVADNRAAADKAAQTSLAELIQTLVTGVADAALKDRAYELALRIGATHVVVGHVNAGAASYGVRTMMLRVEPRALAYVDQSSLDPELLDLGLRVHGIAGKVVEALANFPEDSLVSDVAPAAVVAAIAPPPARAPPPPPVAAPPAPPRPPPPPPPVVASPTPAPLPIARAALAPGGDTGIMVASAPGTAPGIFPGAIVTAPPVEPPQTFVLQPPPVPPPPPPTLEGPSWYRRWWVWTSIGVIAAGSAAAVFYVAGDDLFPAPDEAQQTGTVRVSW